MVYQSQTRRVFVSNFLGALTAPLIIPRKVSSGTVGAISFFVAGVRFQEAIAGLSIGTPVTVMPSRLDEALNYSVLTSTGGLIGYVPKNAVPLVRRLEGRAAYLSIANYDAVPWKRFLVTITD
jgi:hypothetical protein